MFTPFFGFVLILVIAQLFPVNAIIQSQPLSGDAVNWLSACVKDGNNNDFIIVSGLSEGCVCWGYYYDVVETTGWSYLFIESNANFSNVIQASAAGFLEATLTPKRIYQYKRNSFYEMFDDINMAGDDSVNMTSIYNWVNNNYQWTLDNINKYSIDLNASNTHYPSDTSAFWSVVNLMIIQLKGLAKGMANYDYNVSFMDLLYMNLNGDMEDITSIITTPSWDNQLNISSNLNKLHIRKQGDSHCSALVRLLPDLSDVYFSHNTWSTFNTQLRVYKQYNLNYHGVNNSQIMFSGYPGVLYSIDDFYVLRDMNMTVMETTNSIYNFSAYNYAQPGVTTWQRAMVANRLAGNNDDWSKFFSFSNSGTYNNQWIIFDHKKFTAGFLPQNKSLYIVSQMPGSIHTLDVTPLFIQQGYWPSFNIPYFHDLFTISGLSDLEREYGSYYFGYFGNYRQALFAREAPTITSIDDMKRVMVLNKWQSDPLSHNNSMFAIASRYDLAADPNVPEFYPDQFGANDVKLTSHSSLMTSFPLVWARSGPTHDDQPPFNFDDWPGVPHEGIPDLFQFDWVVFTWAPSSNSLRSSSSSDSSSLSSGAIAGIVIGCLVILVLLIFIYYKCLASRRKNNPETAKLLDSSQYTRSDL